MDQIVTIKLFGQTHSFKVDEDLGKAREIVDYLVKEVEKAENLLHEKSPSVSNQTILLLAALNISGKYFDIKKEHDILKSNISERSSKLLQKIDMS